MDNVNLKKKMSVYLINKGQLRNVSDELLHEILTGRVARGPSYSLLQGRNCVRFFKEGLMILFSRRTKIFVAKEPTDMRSSYDSLFLKAKDTIGQDPSSGHLLVFMNARRTACKCLFYDGTGLVLICKRLEKGGFFTKLNPHHLGDIVFTPSRVLALFRGGRPPKAFRRKPESI